MSNPASDPDPDGPEWDEPRALDEEHEEHEEPAAAECCGDGPRLHDESSPPDDPDEPIALELEDAAPPDEPRGDLFELTPNPCLDEPDRDDPIRPSPVVPTMLPDDDQHTPRSSMSRLVGGVVGVAAVATIGGVLWFTLGDRPKKQRGAVADAGPGTGAALNPPANPTPPAPVPSVPTSPTPGTTGVVTPAPPVEPNAGQPQPEQPVVPPGDVPQENPPANPKPATPPKPDEVDPKDPPKPVPPVKEPKAKPAAGPIGPFAGGENPQPTPKPGPAATAPKPPALIKIPKPSSTDLERDPP